MNAKLTTFWEKLESFLDSFFAMQGALFSRLLEKLFQYTYRETESGIFGIFDEPQAIREAARQAKEKGYTRFDCLTPFPIHHLESDMGLNRSRLPYITFFAGSLGLFGAFFLQTLAHEQIIPPLFSFLDGLPNLRSYPLNIGGKPTFSWPPMVPLCFEFTVLLGGHLTVMGLLLVGRLFSPFRRVLHPDITCDKFCLWIPSDSDHYSQEGVRSFLAHLGASEITLVDKDETKPLVHHSGGESS